MAGVMQSPVADTMERGVDFAEEPKSVKNSEEPKSIKNSGTRLERAGTQLQRAGTNLSFQRATTLPSDTKTLRHAAVMPITHDIESDRPFCCGLWKLQQFFGCVLGLACFLGCWFFEPIEINGASNRMLGIALLCGWFWVFEVLPIYMTALLPIVMMPMWGITSSDLAAEAYWSPIQILIVGTYLVDIALEEVQLPKRVALQLLKTTGVVHPGFIILVLMFASFWLSMVCNNIAVALMISPFAIGLMNAAEMHVLDEAQAEEEGRSEASSSVDNPRTAEVQRFSTGLLLGIAYSTTAGGMASLIGSIPNELLMGDDALAQHITFTNWTLFAFPVAAATFVVSFLVIYFRYVHGAAHKTVTPEMLEAEQEELIREVGPLSRDELIVAAIQVVQFFLLFGGHWIREFSIFLSPVGEPLLGDSTMACLPALFLFFIPSVAKPGQPLLTWLEVQEKFDFGLLLLIGGGFAIAKGFVESGLNLALGDWVSSVIDASTPLELTFVIVLICTVATQLFSAVGTATTVIPVLKAAAARSVHNPLGLVLPATVACSFAFMLPTATPANVVVLAKSRDLTSPIRMRDFFLTGLPVNLVMLVIGSLLLFWLGMAVYDAHSPFPAWACDDVSCIWMNVSGLVDGVQVAAQACTFDLKSNMTDCRLANGTTIVVPDSFFASMPVGVGCN